MSRSAAIDFGRRVFFGLRGYAWERAGLEQSGWDRDAVDCPRHVPWVVFGWERDALLLEILHRVRVFVPRAGTTRPLPWTWWNSPAGAATDADRLTPQFSI